MEKILNKVNGFIPTLTALVVLFGFLFYMVAYFFIKGLDVGYGVSSIVGSQQELVANGLILSIGLVGEIAVQAFWSIITNWYFIIIGLLGGGGMLLFDIFIKKDSHITFSLSIEKYTKYLSSFLIIIYIFISFPLTAFEKGSHFAQNEIKKLNEKGCKIESEMWGKCSLVTYQKGDEIVKLNGLLLDKKGQEITLYLPKEKILRTFVLPSDAIIERNSITN
ncbi:hypothetical protein [Psychromonas sp. Urea-02u-13]|uniref:hypothetical protein n=1 Tax=Psychromonas sp. Urea-02u-13 TaxID=2058326 RepID=UPI000C335DD0|nr:hypothetical protein [Psychromonas sp. Urea-02u-13]PKG38930.1 hypothetical protein CXF74_10795 [Psychromonas sp. Urea-02u-13]